MPKTLLTQNPADWRGIAYPIIAGLLTVLMAILGSRIESSAARIALAWVMVLPLLTAYAYGTRGGLIAGLPTILLPMIIWPEQGWACLLVGLITFGIVSLTGYLASLNKGNSTLMALALPLLSLLDIVFFPSLLALPPPFWSQDPVSSLPNDLILGIAVKGVLTLLACSLLAAHLVRVKAVRSFLGLPRLKEYRNAPAVLCGAIISAILLLFLYELLTTIFDGTDQPKIPDLSQYSTMVTFFINLSASLMVGLYFTGLLAQRNLSEQRLAKSEKRFKTLLAEFPDLIFVLSRDGRFIDYYVADASMLLLEPENFIGRYYHEIMPKNISRLMDQVIKEGQREKTRHSFELDLDGKIHVFETRVAFLGPEEVTLITRDVTAESKREKQIARLETQLLNEQKHSAIGVLAGSVAHEINNPLTGVINLAQLVADKTTDHSQDELLETINHFSREIIAEGERITAIVRNLLSVSRTSSPGPVLTSALKLIENVIPLATKLFIKDDIYIRLIIDEQAPKTMCRPDQIRQVLLNLLTNARDALDDAKDEKLITIKAQGYQDEQAWLRISVKDNGSGIASDQLDQIFMPFFSTKTPDRGTGFGLAVSREIIERHQGRLKCETIANEGTIFFVDLPATGS